MCKFVEMTINAGKPDETVVVDQVDCNNPSGPSSNTNPDNK
jgi:hypothetical protein